MLRNHGLTFAWGNIINDDIIGVNIYGLKADYQLFQRRTSWSHHENVAIANIEFVFVLRQKLEITFRIGFIHSDDKETKLFVKLVGQNIENVIFFIVDDFFYDSNVKLFVQINFYLLFDVLINTVIIRCNDHNVLLLIHGEEFRLSVERNIELIYRIDRILIVIDLDDTVLLHKDKSIGLSAFIGSFKVELHADFIHDWDVLDDDSFV